MKKDKGLIILIGILFLPVLTHAITLGYKSDAPYSYGAGVDMDFPLLKKENCVKYDEPILIDGGASVNFESKVVMESSEVIEKLNNNLDVVASGYWGKVKIGAGFHHLTEKEKEQLDESTFMMISAEVDFGRKRSKNFSLYPKYQELIDQGKNEEFVRRCGNYFVDTEHNKAIITAVIKAKGLTNSLKKKIVNSLNLNVSVPTVGEAEIKNTSSKIFSTLQKYSTLEVKFFANSGDGATALKDIIIASSNVDYQAIIKAISSYVQKINKDNTPPYSYDLTSMSFFGLSMPPVNIKRQKYLESAYVSYLNAKSYEEKLLKIEKEANLTEGTLNVQRTKLKSYMSLVERMALSCYDDRDGDMNLCSKKIPSLKYISMEHIEGINVRMDCQYIESLKPGYGILDNLVISIDGRFSFWNLIQESSISVLKETVSGELLKVKGTKMILSDHITYGSKLRFLINHKTPKAFKNYSEKPGFTHQNLEFAEDNYDLEKNSLYYLELSDINNNHFVYYLGRPSGQCSIDQAL